MDEVIKEISKRIDFWKIARDRYPDIDADNVVGELENLKSYFETKRKAAERADED